MRKSFHLSHSETYPVQTIPLFNSVKFSQIQYRKSNWVFLIFPTRSRKTWRSAVGNETFGDIWMVRVGTGEKFVRIGLLSRLSVCMSSDTRCWRCFSKSWSCARFSALSLSRHAAINYIINLSFQISHFYYGLGLGNTVHICRLCTDRTQ